MTYKAEKVLPYAGNEAPKGIQVEKMFDEIAGQYDLLNHTLSFGIDKYWRKKGILSLQEIHPQKNIGYTTGTGDLSIQAYKLLQPEKITGIDISEGMMQIGKEKVAKAGLSTKIEFEWQDCMALTFPDHSIEIFVDSKSQMMTNTENGAKRIGTGTIIIITPPSKNYNIFL